MQQHIELIGLNWVLGTLGSAENGLEFLRWLLYAPQYMWFFKSIDDKNVFVELNNVLQKLQALKP